MSSPHVPPGHDLPQLLAVLDAVTAEIEAFVASAGWDQPPALFALVPTATVAADPQGAALLGTEGISTITAASLTPIAQDPLPDQPLDEALAGIEWPPEVAGCALSQEIVMLPPEAEAALSHPLAVSEAAIHPQRREARLVVAVLRDGQAASVLRLRGAAAAGPQTGSSAGSRTGSSAGSQTGASAGPQTGSSAGSQTGASAGPQTGSSADEIAFGADLAPNLTAALRATLT